jgi:hypothetical protein
MRFDSEITTSSLNKLYYGLKELANRRINRTISCPFNHLETLDTEHIKPLQDSERVVKLEYFRQFIREPLIILERWIKTRLLVVLLICC